MQDDFGGHSSGKMSLVKREMRYVGSILYELFYQRKAVKGLKVPVAREFAGKVMNVIRVSSRA
jgi:hypothetical protein